MRRHEQAKDKNLEIFEKDKVAKGKILDRKKIDVLVNELSEYLNFEDIFEIKKQINQLNKQGKLLPQRT